MPGQRRTPGMKLHQPEVDSVLPANPEAPSTRLHGSYDAGKPPASLVVLSGTVDRRGNASSKRGTVVEADTASTTHRPHRLCRGAAGRSRSQPVRSARKCLLQPVITGRHRGGLHSHAGSQGTSRGSFGRRRICNRGTLPEGCVRRELRGICRRCRCLRLARRGGLRRDRRPGAWRGCQRRSCGPSSG
jgi:hypothetical protein